MPSAVWALCSLNARRRTDNQPTRRHYHTDTLKRPPCHSERTAPHKPLSRATEPGHKQSPASLPGVKIYNAKTAKLLLKCCKTQTWHFYLIFLLLLRSLLATCLNSVSAFKVKCRMVTDFTNQKCLFYETRAQYMLHMWKDFAAFQSEKLCVLLLH